ncbi:MAG: protein-glutamine glutaminase family protein [Oligoflexia bacterium]|nr:protein-glutamine glutaminase family protein [Oligoflexia bacterium]
MHCFVRLLAGLSLIHAMVSSLAFGGPGDPPVLPPHFTRADLIATPISIEDAQSWYAELATQQDIPYQFVFDGCYARAEKIAQILEQNGIIALKLFIEADPETTQFKVRDRFDPSCYVQWIYHVTVAVLVQNEPGYREPRLMVIDPSLFGEAVDANVWINEIGYTNGGNFKATYQPRFAYKNREPFYSDWQPQDLMDMDQVNHANVGKPSQCNSRQ